MSDEIKPGDRLRDTVLSPEGGGVWTVVEVIRHPTVPDEVWVNLERATVVERQVRGYMVGPHSRFQPIREAENA